MRAYIYIYVYRYRYVEMRIHVCILDIYIYTQHRLKNEVHMSAYIYIHIQIMNNEVKLMNYAQLCTHLCIEDKYHELFARMYACIYMYIFFNYSYGCVCVHMCT